VVKDKRKPSLEETIQKGDSEEEGGAAVTSVLDLLDKASKGEASPTTRLHQPSFFIPKKKKKRSCVSKDS